MITITYDNKSTRQIEEGLTLEQVLALLPARKRMPVAARVNGVLQELDYSLFVDSSVEWIDNNCEWGWRIYRRTLVFLLQYAVRELFPTRELYVSHSLSEGVFCWLKSSDGTQLTAAEVDSLQTRMQEYVAADMAISRHQVSKEDAAAYFRVRGQSAKAEQIERLDSGFVSLHSVGEYRDYLYGVMAPSAAYVAQFNLLAYDGGLVLQLPARQYLGCRDRADFLHKQLQTTLAEHEEWSKLMGVCTASDLNNIIRAGGDAFTELVLIAETMQERNLHRISDAIFADFPKVRLVLIAGPSSSGKTTTCRRLGLQFRTIGVHPVMISLDDYFVDRETTPRNDKGQPDYEGLGALNIELFQQNMRDLLAGRETVLPSYDFISGKSLRESRSLRLADDQILLVEGIHALNETISAEIPAQNKRKLFVSALNQINLDESTPVSTGDNRLMRRMVRDMQFRGQPPQKTLLQWEDVRRGEHRNIFPFQEQADFFFNSVQIYELPVLRPLVESSLLEVEPDDPAYHKAQRLLWLIRCFEPAPSDAVPRHSILREFLGDSLFAQ